MTAQFSPNERFDGVFLLKSIDERLTRSGKPYLALVLGSPAADVEARVWDMEQKSLPGLVEGVPVQVRGTAQLYQEKLQLIIETIEKVQEPVNPRAIFPSTIRSEEELRREFRSRVDDIGNRSLSSLMTVMREDIAVFDAFFISPAAITMHHARIGGLAEHSLGVCQIALGVAEAAAFLDRDLLTVGALLHDTGKILEYEVAGDLRYTLDGKFIGHIARGVSIVEDWIRLIPGFPERLALELLHIILSHHGQLELGSPKAPVTAEALVVHNADDLDAKLDMIRSAAPDPPGGEAFVRGLRRTFQFRTENQSGEKTVQGPTSNVQREKRGEGHRVQDGEEPEVRSQKTEEKRQEPEEAPPEGDGQEDDQGELF